MRDCRRIAQRIIGTDVDTVWVARRVTQNAEGLIDQDISQPTAHIVDSKVRFSYAEELTRRERIVAIPHLAHQRNNRHTAKIPSSAVLAFAVDKFPAFCRQRACCHSLFLVCIRLYENKLCDTSQLILTDLLYGIKVDHKSVRQIIAVRFQICHTHILSIALHLIHDDIRDALQLCTAGSLLHKVLDAGAQEVNVLAEGFPQL